MRLEDTLFTIFEHRPSKVLVTKSFLENLYSEIDRKFDLSRQETFNAIDAKSLDIPTTIV